MHLVVDLFMKAVPVAFGVLVASILVHLRRQKVKRRLAEIDNGKRCFACEGTDVVRYGDRVTCQTCGHVSSLSQLARIRPSQKELDDMIRPDDWHSSP